jgi:hypothetical protein
MDTPRRRVTTTLLDLTRVLGTRFEDDRLVARAVLSILRRGRARFVDPACNPHAGEPGRRLRNPSAGGSG